MKALAILLVIVSSVATLNSTAQDSDGPARAIYVEAFGNSPIWSLNYDTRFASKDGVGGRIGIGYTYLGTFWGSIITSPLMINYLFGKDNNFFELGLGGIISFNGTTFVGASRSPVTGTITLGYRRQPADGGLLFKIALTPLFGFEENYRYTGSGNSRTSSFVFNPLFGGISFGYAF